MCQGGLQELGETFEEVAIRELYEETGLIVKREDLKLVQVIAGESRKNSYPNGDQVYNNTVLYCVKSYDGTLNCDYEEKSMDQNNMFFVQKESKSLKFFPLDQLPEKLMDLDLIEAYKKYVQKKRKKVIIRRN